MPETSYDCIVIGSGPGGYVAAIRAAQLGMKTAVIEKDTVGGRCLNYACIPAKAVLRTADILTEIEEAGDFGITVDSASVDFGAVMERRQKVIKTLTGGVSGLFKKNKIDYIEGFGSVTGEGNVKVGGNFDGTEIEATKCVVLACGSVPKPIPGTQFGGRVIGTEEAWALADKPGKIAVVGAGASGAEIASAYGAARHRGAALRGARPRAADRGRRHLQGRRAGARQAEHDDPHRHDGGERPGLGRQRLVHVRRPERRGRVVHHRRRPRARRRGPRARRGRRQARRQRTDRGRRRAAHVGQGRLRDRRPRAGPRARAQGLRRGRHRRRGRRRPGDAPDRVHRHPARDVLHAQRRLLRADRGAGARAGPRRRRRQGPVRRGRRRHRLRRPQRRGQDRRRQEVRRAGRRPHRRLAARPS